MITEDYVSFEIAKILKEKGFNEPCHTWQRENENINYCDILLDYSDMFEEHNEYLVPTFQMVMKWLKEIHNIFISISITYIVGYKKPTYLWIPCVIKQNYIDYPTMEEYMADSYEEACEKAIKYCLTNLI